MLKSAGFVLASHGARLHPAACHPAAHRTQLATVCPSTHPWSLGRADWAVEVGGALGPVMARCVRRPMAHRARPAFGMGEEGRIDG